MSNRKSSHYSGGIPIKSVHGSPIGGKEHTEQKVLADLLNKRVNIGTIQYTLGDGTVQHQPTISIQKQTQPLGNKSWGKIDYLINHLGYRKVAGK